MTEFADLQISPEIFADAKVLVIDDDQLVTSSLNAFFSLEMDLEPTTFNSSPEAMKFIDTNEPDLIISDFLMPEVDGIQLLRHARELHPEVPRVLLTGYADKENAIRAINDVQLFQYIEKPWENEMLRKVVENGVERTLLLRMLLGKLEELSSSREELKAARRSVLRIFA